MALIVGPPGPTAVHRPEICYSSQDYTQEGATRRVTVTAEDDSGTGEFWTLTFRPNDVDSLPLSVYYAWSNGDRWEAPENPRLSHSGAKILYKIQLAGDKPDASPTDPCESFLQSMLAQPHLPASGQ
jgi:hypothetical protein